MPDPREIFTDAMPDWQIVDAPTPAAADSIGQKRDRVAVELPELRQQYQRMLSQNAARPTPRASGGDDAAQVTAAHAEFVRAKKKGGDDGLAEGQTFIVSGSRVIGAQG